MLCFVCTQQNAESNLLVAHSKEAIFIETGFSNWKKALSRFEEHQKSECHKMAMAFLMIPKTHGNIRELTSNAAKKQMEQNHHCLLKIFEGIHFLGRKGLALQGKKGNELNSFLKS